MRTDCAHGQALCSVTWKLILAEKKRLLCVVYEPGNFQVWLKLAHQGLESGEFDVILWSPYSLPDSDRYQTEARAAGTVYVEETSPAGGVADIYSRLSGWFSAKPARLPRDLLLHMSGASTTPTSSETTLKAWVLFSELAPPERYAVLCAVDRVRRRINICEDWLVKLGIDAVVFAEDNVERDSYGWIEAARRRDIRTVVSSYGAISAQEAVTAYKHSPDHALRPELVALVRSYLPHWLAEGEHFAITRLPFAEMLAREITGVAPFNPWLVNSGHSHSIALESVAMEKVYREFGFPSENLKVIGHPLQDVIAGAARDRVEKRKTLAAQYGLSSPDLPLAVVAMPPDQSSSRPCSYSTYAELVAAFARLPYEMAGLNVIVSPHPNISEEGRALIRATEAILIETSVSDLLPLADVYIACVSSTIKWALGCGVPTINYDCYGYGYSDYLGTPQVINVSNDAAFRDALRVIADPEQRNRLTDLARQGTADWGVFDGKALDRLIRLLLDNDI